MAETKLVLGYWGIRGLAQQLRNLLEYLNLPYQDKQYTDREEWFAKDKLNFKSDFPNLPYLIDGDKYITESEAIMVHLVLKANRADLLGSTPEERVHIAQLKGVLMDCRRDFYGVVANKSLTDLHKEFNEKVLPRLTLVSKHLGSNEFLTGKLSILDFAFAEFLGGLLIQDGDWLATLPNFKTYAERVRNLPGLKEYNASGRASAFYSAPDYLNAHFKISA